jgi:hypothetical protein
MGFCRLPWCSLHPPNPEPVCVEQRLLPRSGPDDAPTEREDNAQSPGDDTLVPRSAELIHTQIAVLVLIQLRLEPRAIRGHCDRHCPRPGWKGRRGACDQTYPQAAQRSSKVATLTVPSRIRPDAQLRHAKPWIVGRSCRVCLRRAMGSEALVPLDAARTFRYWQAVELLFYRLSATKRPIAIARRRVASCATARREVPRGSDYCRRVNNVLRSF